MSHLSTVAFAVLFALAFSAPHAEAFGKRRMQPETRPAPPPGPFLEHGDLKIRVLNYNVHGLSLPWTDTDRFDDIGDILAARRAQGTAPDIVLIEEGFHAAIENLFKRARYPYRKSGPGPDWPRTGSGLIVLSEFPITGWNSIIFDYSNTAGIDWNANKGIQLVKIRLPGLAVPLEVLNTHLQADYDDITASLDETIPARRRQIVELGRFFSRTTSPAGPAIFGGDFNTNTMVGDYYDILAQTPLIDAAETCLFTRACEQNVDPESEMRHSLDHQFYRSGSTVRVEPVSYEKSFRDPVKGRMLSDHEGLEVQYRITW